MKAHSRKPIRRGQGARVLTLLVVDNGPLSHAAWERLARARRRLTKLTEELHRHEQQDVPAHRSWMFATCPALLSEIRELTVLYESKSALIARVEAHARAAGKPASLIWQLYKGQGATAENFSRDAEDAHASEEEREHDEIERRGMDQMIEEFLRDEGIDPLSPEAEMIRDLGETFQRDGTAESSRDAKEIYRRLVQRLHPDRGGDWSREREALWHEVQQAWDARDADWLARLEAELEIAGATLNPNSALSRLYAALAQVESARRDAERKLRDYRKTPAWRFTAEVRKSTDRAKLAASLEDERDRLRGFLAHVEATFVRWEKPLGQARAKQRSGVRLPASRRTASRTASGPGKLETGGDD